MEWSRWRTADLYNALPGYIKPWKPQMRLDAKILPLYSYRFLSSNEIRYFELKKGRYDDDIHIRIDHKSIHAETDYEAISYVWGAPNKELKPIFVNGSSILWVTQNLWIALKTVRQRGRPRVLWADAICIDQNDDNGTEKSHQLQHMSWIYPRAKRVLCCLGDDNGTASEAFLELDGWARAYHDPNLLVRILPELKNRLKIGVIKPLPAVADLFDQPYWRRAWCLQEVCVDARRPPQLIYGRQQLSWEMLYYGFLCLIENLDSRESVALLGDSVGYLLPMLTTCWLPPEEMLLSKLLLHAARRQASVTHDMIFSLLGLAERRGVKFPTPDYKRTIEETCVIYTRAIIELDQRLDILSAVASSRQDDDVPSWCIKPGRWAKTVADDIGPMDERVDGKYIYCATLETTPCIEVSQDAADLVLSIHGFELDRIAQVLDLQEFLAHSLAAAECWADIIRICNNFCSDKLTFAPLLAGNNEQDQIAKAFLTTLTCDDFWISSSKQRQAVLADRCFTAYQAFDSRQDAQIPLSKDELIRYLGEHFNFGVLPPGGKNDNFLHGAIGKDVPMHQFLDRYASSELKRCINEKLRKRKFMVSEQGRFGVGPLECVVGDVACLFPGSSVPLILRETGCCETQIYILVGDAYVNGVMRGEFMRGKVNKDGSLQLDGCEEWKMFNIM